MRAPMDCSVGSKAEVAACSSPTAATSDTAPVVARKRRRSMKSPLCALSIGCVAPPRVLGADSVAKYFLRNSLQGSVDLLLICDSAMRYLIYRLCLVKYNAAGDEYQ